MSIFVEDSPWVFVFMTVIIGGGAAFLAGRAFVTDTAVLVAAALFGYRVTQAALMVGQYPWLYERSGPFSWRRKSSAT
jgi:hypothetical protein